MERASGVNMTNEKLSMTPTACLFPKGPLAPSALSHADKSRTLRFRDCRGVRRMHKRRKATSREHAPGPPLPTFYAHGSMLHAKTAPANRGCFLGDVKYRGVIYEYQLGCFPLDSSYTTIVIVFTIDKYLTIIRIILTFWQVFQSVAGTNLS